MNRLVALILLILTMYLVAKHKNNGLDPIFKQDVDPAETLEGNRELEKLPQEKLPELEGSNFEQSISKILLNIMKTDKGRLVIEKILRPTYAPVEDSDFTIMAGSRKGIDTIFNVEEKIPGIGRQAVCGHKVKVEYKIINMNDLIIDTGTKDIILGEGKVFFAFDNIIVGMQEGATRKALVNKAFAYEHKNYKGKKPINETNDYRVEVKLLEILSDMHFGDGLRLFDDKVSLSLPVMCGQRAGFNLKIEEMGGAIIYDTKLKNREMNFILGDETVPILFSHALFAKDNKGSRIVFTPGKYLKRFDSAIFGLMNKELIKDDKYYLLEFSDIKYEKINANQTSTK